MSRRPFIYTDDVDLALSREDARRVVDAAALTAGDLRASPSSLGLILSPPEMCNVILSPGDVAGGRYRRCPHMFPHDAKKRDAALKVFSSNVGLGEVAPEGVSTPGAVKRAAF